LSSAFGPPAPFNGLFYFFHFYQVFHFTDHTQYLRSSFHLFGGMHLIETKSFQGKFLTLGPVDAALYLRDFNLCHSLII
jgi:hypothetical protein